jgi:acyl-coenzyme A synthetase/AMP-(fatty) acid ligase
MTSASNFQILCREIESETLSSNFGEVFDNAVRAYATKPAWIPVDSPSSALTYADLADLVAKSASAFAHMGVRKGSHVGLIMPTAPEHLAAWVALAKLGAVSIGINPSYTPNELKYTLTDGKADYVLVASDFLDNLKNSGVIGSIVDAKNVVVWEGKSESSEIWNKLLESAKDIPEFASIALEDPINILYTSGSTGFPKGCVLPHSYWVVKGKVMAKLWPDVTRIQSDAPFHYMGPLWRFAFACYLGAAVCVSPRASLTRFMKRWQDNNIDFGWVNNAMSMTTPGETDGKNNLKVLGASNINPRLHRAAEARFNAVIREHYGMTEIGLAIVMPKEAVEMVGSGSCGVVAPFRDCMIADESGNPVATGEIGELYVSGMGIVKEYIGRPEVNRDAFTGKWFKTGDLFRQDENGFYYFHSRIKDIIRRSSENISATEVEAALATIAEIEEVAVGPVADPMRGEEVKAFIILKEDKSPDTVTPASIIAHCSHLLARYKIPRYFQFFSEFPRTSSNKIAKKLLLDGQGTSVTDTFDVTSGKWS